MGIPDQTPSSRQQGARAFSCRFVLNHHSTHPAHPAPCPSPRSKISASSRQSSPRPQPTSSSSLISTPPGESPALYLASAPHMLIAFRLSPGAGPAKPSLRSTSSSLTSFSMRRSSRSTSTRSPRSPSSSMFALCRRSSFSRAATRSTRWVSHCCCSVVCLSARRGRTRRSSQRSERTRAHLVSF